MSYRQKLVNHYSKKRFPAILQPAPPWIAIMGFVLCSVLLILVGAGKILNLAFPVGAFLVGLFLYFRYPILYIGFTWWLWFLTPLIRRLSDWSSRTYTEPSPLLIAPYLVTLISIITLLRYFPKVYRQGELQFLLSFVAVVYGIAVGLIFRPPIALIISGLDWLVPVVFGFHLFTNWRSYLSYRQNIQRVFLWGVLIMGIYGVIQFCISPPWDAYWLIKSEFTTGSVGKPENVQAFSINVWSTMSSNRPFGTVMMAGLILLLINEFKGNLGLPATIAGYLSFLLARKRTPWTSWLVAILILFGSLKARTQKQIMIGIAILIVLLIALSNIEPFSEFIYSRFDTFSDLESDGSANARLEIYSNSIDQALTSFFGQGIGGKSYDSGILSMLLDIGGLGTVFYLGDIILLFLNLFQKSCPIFDPFISVARAISLSVFMQLPLGSSHIGAQGLILWGFLSMAMAGQKYYRYRDRNPTIVDDDSSSSYSPSSSYLEF